MIKNFILILPLLGCWLNMTGQVSVVGTATPAGNWYIPTAMIQNPADSSEWHISLFLSSNEVKFVLESSGDSIGGTTFPLGTGTVDGPALNIPAGGFYGILFNDETLEFSFSTGLVGINSPVPLTSLDVTGGVNFRGIQLSPVNNAVTIPENVSLATITYGAYDTVQVNLPLSSADGWRLIIQNWSANVARVELGNNQAFIPAGRAAEFLLSTYSGWTQLYSSNFANENSIWQTLGNVGTDASYHFLGTRDSMGLSFRTNYTERMKISALGNVGIGTADPDDYTFKLDVTGSSGNVLRLNTMNNSATEDRTSLAYYSDNILRSEIASVMSTPLLARLGFFTGVSIPYLNIYPEERLSIESGGQVGIGNTAPTQKLEVNGKIKLSDDATAPLAGTIRWNDMKHDFEGYNGTEWLSFTKSPQGGWGGIDQIQEDEIEPPPLPDAYRRMGTVLAMKGAYAIVGSHVNGNYYYGQSTQGKAYVFKFDDIGNCWNFLDTLEASDGLPDDGFGKAVAISGSYIIVGAPDADDFPDDQAGKVYIFRNTGSSFVEEAILYGEDQNDNFGSSVQLNEAGHLIVGAPSADYNGDDNRGKAYIYFIWGPGGNDYTELLTIIDNPTSGTFSFGKYVDMTDNYYAYISAVTEDKTVIYHYEQQGGLYNFYNIGSISSASGVLNSYENLGDTEGWLIVGRPNQTVAGQTNQGMAKIYRRSGATWTLNDELYGGDSEAGDLFGSSVDVFGSYCIAGAPEANVQGQNNQGKAYVFYKSGNNWNQKAILLASDGLQNNRFGSAVALTEYYAGIGIPYKAAGGNPEQGGVYFFRK